MSLAERLASAQRDLFAKMEEDRATYQLLMGLSIRLGSISPGAPSYETAVASIEEEFTALQAL